MIIEFHFAGENRKKLAWVVAMIIGTTAEYQYMPTCAYKIGECYTVTTVSYTHLTLPTIA